MNNHIQTGKNRNKIPGYIFLALRAGLPFIISTAAGLVTGLWWIGWFIYIPIHELLRPPIEFFFAKKLKTSRLPQTELFGKIPESHKTLILLPCSRISKKSAERFFALAEKCAEKSENIGFCLFLKSEKSEPNQDFIYEKITELNKEFGGGFSFVFKGKNIQNHVLAVKQGAVTETVRYIKTGIHEFEEVFGDISFFDGVKNLITVNETTNFDFDAVINLISAASHPQNRAEVSPDSKVVIKGYGIISPMVISRLDNCCRSFFSTLYNRKNLETSEDYLCKRIYMNTFDFGIFEGVGLIRTDAFYSCLNQNIPIEKIATHNIIEGSFLRCGICFESEMTEVYDGTAEQFFHRVKNMSRGYFQSLFWLLPFINLGGKREKNPVVFLNKIFLSDRITHLLGPLMSFLTIVISPFIPFGAGFFILSLFSAVSFEISDIILLISKNVTSLFTGKKHRKNYTVKFALTLCLFKLITLPQSAFFTLYGAAEGIYLRITSKKHGPKFKTPDKNPLLWISYVVSFAFAAFLFFSTPAFCKICAFLFAAGPFVIYSVDRKSTVRRV